MDHARNARFNGIHTGMHTVDRGMNQKQIYTNDYINGYYGKGNGSYFVFDGTKKCRRGSGHYSKSRRGICK